MPTAAPDTGDFLSDKGRKNIARKLCENLSSQGKFPRPLAVGIMKHTRFFPAEDYHCDYAAKNPMHYGAYRVGSGREGFLVPDLGRRYLPPATPAK